MTRALATHLRLIAENTDPLAEWAWVRSEHRRLDNAARVAACMGGRVNDQAVAEADRAVEDCRAKILTMIVTSARERVPGLTIDTLREILG